VDIPRIYHVYTLNDIPCISMDTPCIYCVDTHGLSMYIPGISTSMDIHGISMDIQCISHAYVGHLHMHGMYMHGIYQKYGFQMSTASMWCMNGINSQWPDGAGAANGTR
jgi:hypothetical protein